ncbi:MAG TPA: MFS transporter, partial [Burkholderiales bacterium]|nr:MFS transporter [Burkholderiales bacterium]
SPSSRASALAPFEVRSFRFQWPADLATSWAFEMEALILGWYVLVTTGSVELLVVFGALAWLGSLFSPFFGIAGDRLGMRRLLCITRGAYALLAAVLTALALSRALQPWHVIVISAIAGLMRPSDMAMRAVLVGQTMRPEILMGALGISRTTYDTARVAGALTGTGAVALIGMGPAYVLVTLVYVAAFLLSLGVGGSAGHSVRGRTAETLAGLRSAVAYVWHKPDLLGAVSVAFLVNLLAFPFFLGLLPYVARNVYGIDQSGLGYLAAAFAGGALVGSLVVGAARLPLRAGRVMLWSAALWFVAILLFGQNRSVGIGLGLLFAAGFVQSLCMTPLAAVILRTSSEEMRGRVMGIRVLAIWGLPLGLLAAGPFISGIGYPATTLVYAGLGLAATLAIALRWREALWRPSAPANAHL